MIEFKNISEIIDWKLIEQEKVLNQIENKYFDYVIQLQSNCKHLYPDGNNAVEEFCDDDDADGFHIPTYESWMECKICGKHWTMTE